MTDIAPHPILMSDHKPTVRHKPQGITNVFQGHVHTRMGLADGGLVVSDCSYITLPNFLASQAELTYIHSSSNRADLRNTLTAQAAKSYLGMESQRSMLVPRLQWLVQTFNFALENSAEHSGDFHVDKPPHEEAASPAPIFTQGNNSWPVQRLVL